MLATVSDLKLPAAKVLSHTDYYAFGSAMPGRSGGAGYRYGFNGKEKADEVGAGVTDFSERLHHAGIGRWLSLDPLAAKYPGLSPYNAMGNNPIAMVDPDGREIIPYNLKLEFNKKGQLIKVVFDVKVKMTFVDLTQKGMGAMLEAKAKLQQDKISTLLSGTGDLDINTVDGMVLYNEVLKQDKSVMLAENVTFQVNNVSIDAEYTSTLNAKIRHNDHVIMLVDEIKESEYSSTDPSIIKPYGIAQIGGRVSLVVQSGFNNPSRVHTTTHEFGHNLGLPHPCNTLACNDKDMTLMGYGDKSSYNVSSKERGKIFRGILDAFRSLRVIGNRERKSAYQESKKFLEENAKTYNKKAVE